MAQTALRKQKKRVSGRSEHRVFRPGHICILPFPRPQSRDLKVETSKLGRRKLVIPILTYLQNLCPFCNYSKQRRYEFEFVYLTHMLAGFAVGPEDLEQPDFWASTERVEVSVLTLARCLNLYLCLPCKEIIHILEIFLCNSAMDVVQIDRTVC